LYFVYLNFLTELGLTGRGTRISLPIVKKCPVICFCRWTCCHL